MILEYSPRLAEQTIVEQKNLKLVKVKTSVV